MSLTRLLEMKEVTAAVKPLRPKLSRKIPAPLRVEPRSQRFMMVGTAFDYLLRFELQRRAPHATARRWGAERAPDIIWGTSDKGTVAFLHLQRDAQGVVSLMAGPDAWMHADEELAMEVAGRARNVVERAKSAVATYLQNKSPARPELAELAAHAIRLAKLDEPYRAYRLDPTFEEANQEDVEDLLDLLAIAPFDALIHPRLMLLNPDFGETSLLVGGADTDLITGDVLVDFKTTKRTAIQPTDLDQLFGYYLLARHRHQADPTFPEIHRVALYFCRHGHLWVLDSNAWTQHPQFKEIEEWFFDRAKAAFGRWTAGRTEKAANANSPR